MTTMQFEMVEAAPNGAVIKVVGVGGAGGNAINHMINSGVQGVEFIAVNTDRQALSFSMAPTTIQLGADGLGAGAQPERARAAADEAREQLRKALEGANMVFIAAGMGKGTGTGASPVVAEVAREIGALTVGVVTKPFDHEGKQKARIADTGLEALAPNVDSLIVVLNEKLFEITEDDIEELEAFKMADDVLHNAVAGIAEIINVRGLVNVDFADVRTVMSEQGKAMMGVGEAAGIDRARLAAEQAVASPLLEGVDLQGARGVIVNISASRSLKLRETKEIMSTIRHFCAEDATVIHGTVYDDSLGDRLRVTVVATGIGQQRRKPVLVQQPAQRTGTWDAPAEAVGFGRPAGDAGSAPNVWRARDSFGGRDEAARQIAALQNEGMDKLDIPAFLRRQAD